MPTTLRTIFDRIYDKSEWGFGSGPGSDPSHLKEYAAYLNGLIRDLKVKRFLDVGCGDCRLAKMLDLDGVIYIGIDVSKSALQMAIALGIPEDFNLWECTAAEVPVVCDLVHVKDVCQHLPFAAVSELLEDIAKHKHAVITNDAPHFPQDCNPGAYRPIDITQPPINATGYKHDRLFHINGYSKLAIVR